MRLIHAGTSISIYAAQYTYTVSNVSFKIDGIDQGTWSSLNLTANSWKIPIFTSPELSDGPHQLDVTTSRVSGIGLNFTLYVDFMTVNPGSDLTFTRNPGWVLYDDTHPDISYTGPVQAVTAPNVPLYDYISNSSHLMQHGSTFTINFNGMRPLLLHL